MRTLGLIRQAARRRERDLGPELRARLATAAADESVRLEVPAFTWPWRLAAAAGLAAPFLVPEPVRFLVASGLL